MGAGFPAIPRRRREGEELWPWGHFHPQQCPLQHKLWPHPPLTSMLKEGSWGRRDCRWGIRDQGWDQEAGAVTLPSMLPLEGGVGGGVRQGAGHQSSQVMVI